MSKLGFLASLAAAFTIGALACQVHNDRTIAHLNREIDAAYHDGERDAWATIRAETTQRVMEDDPRWDCKTMGNKICGKPLNPKL